MARVKTFDKEEVLRKAVDLFWRKGYNATSMQDLVDTLGINRSSLYDTYGDKRQLYLAALSEYQSSGVEGMISVINDTEDIHQILKWLFSMTVRDCISKDGKKGCFATNSLVELAPHDKDVADIVQANNDKIENALTRAIQKSQKNGELKNTDSPRSLARFVLNTITGLRIIAKSEAGKKKYDDIVDVTMSVLH